MVWGLALAYRKHAELDEDKAKAYELEQVPNHVVFFAVEVCQIALHYFIFQPLITKQHIAYSLISLFFHHATDSITFLINYVGSYLHCFKFIFN